MQGHFILFECPGIVTVHLLTPFDLSLNLLSSVGLFELSGFAAIG